jgi:hypothetical protein
VQYLFCSEGQKNAAAKGKKNAAAKGKKNAAAKGKKIIILGDHRAD